MKDIRIKTLLFFLMLLGTQFVSAQTATLRGKITDAETGEELIGATVMLKGTLTGSAADLDGNYNITAIEPGIYDVVCQYISYETLTITSVEIKDDAPTILDFKLATVSMGLQEVVIAAKAYTRTESALLTVQKKSANVIDGISAQQMKRGGDSDAAGALSRVTGVSVEGGKYVYVRGLGDRYSKTALNGADIPGLDPNRNTVQMDIFPSNLIENIVIHKSFSPDLPANFTGGYVDIVTKDFPETFTLSASIKLGYNTQASFNNQFLSYKGSSTDLLGFDNGMRDLPSAFPHTVPPLTKDNRELLTQNTMLLNKVMAPEYGNGNMDQSYSFSVGNQVNLFGRQLGFIVGLTYKYEESHYTDGVKALYKLTGSSADKLNKEQYYDDTQGSREVLWGAIANISYKFNDNNKIGFNIFRNQSGTSSARYMFGQKPSDDTDLYIETRKLQWMERSFNSYQLRGDHFFSHAGRMKIKWLGSATSSFQKEPDMRFFTNSYYPTNSESNQYQIQPSLYKVPSRYYRDMEESNYFGKMDVEIPLGNEKSKSKIKFGGSYVYKDRVFNDKRIDYKFQFPDKVYNGDVSAFVADTMIGVNYSGYNPISGNNYGLYVAGNEKDDIKNSYTADEKTAAAYVMADLNLLANLRTSFGLRYENSQINAASKDTSLPVGALKNNDFLPAINLTYNFRENMNFRAAYYRTIARPTFRELAPYASEDFAGGETWIGNDSLLQTRIDNIDLRWEYYMKPGEVLSFGAFYKRFTDPIEVVDNPKAQNPELSWENVDEATVYGLEFDFRKNLDFVAALKDFKLGVNFTYVFSQVQIEAEELQLIRATDPEHPDTRQMFGQAPYVLNTYLNYNNRKHGIDASLTFNVTGPKLIINVKGGTPDVYEQAFPLLNFVASKTISKKWLVSLEAHNLLNPDFKQTYTYQNQEYLYRQYSRGVEFKIGLAYKIN